MRWGWRGACVAVEVRIGLVNQSRKYMCDMRLDFAPLDPSCRNITTKVIKLITPYNRLRFTYTPDKAYKVCQVRNKLL